MINLRRFVLPLTMLTFAISIPVFAAEQKEEPTMGIRYLLTDEMADAGVNVWVDGLTTLNDIGEIDVNCDDELMEVVLVMEQDKYDTFTEEQNAEEYYISHHPDANITSAPKGDYIYIYLDFLPALDMTDEGLSKAYALGQDLISAFEYIPVVSKEIPIVLDAPFVFETVNFDGEQVTDAIFADKDITILNIWGAFCNPCVNEMPDLAAWEQELPENVQLIYLCIDALDDSSKETASIIADKAGINRKNTLLLNKEIATALYTYLGTVPTTLYIDKEGNLYDKIVVGAHIDQYKEQLQELLDEQ